MDKILDSWYLLKWFSFATFSNYTWVHPWYLWLIVLVPIILLLYGLIYYFFNQKLPIAIVKGDIKTSPLVFIRFLPPVILGVILTLLLIALARPQQTNEQVDQWAEGIDIILAIDISQSMQIEDFTPNRLEAAKQVANEFISGRVQDRIGIVVFSGEAFSLAPLTTDYDLLKSYLNEINFDMITNRGTAIGSAIAVATNRMSESDSKSKICILLSDGDNTAGNIDPITAAKLAASYNIKIYTIVVGKEGLVPFGKDYFGRPQMVENTIDETTLRKISNIGSGEFFRASNNEALKHVFKKINQYEKVKIKEVRFRNVIDFYFIYLRWAVVLFLFWIFLKSTFIVNVLHD